ncbi:MAG: hypothetical protein OXU51_18045 [Candidatus Poribacteria bacterium]|nr:hypothetical protein [Candidatus Poribacteria bacterium]
MVKKLSNQPITVGWITVVLIFLVTFTVIQFIIIQVDNVDASPDRISYIPYTHHYICPDTGEISYSLVGFASVKEETENHPPCNPYEIKTWDGKIRMGCSHEEHSVAYAILAPGVTYIVKDSTCDEVEDNPGGR